MERIENCSKRKWKSVGTVICAAHVFKDSGEVNVVLNVDDLINDIIRCPGRTTSSSVISYNPSYEAISDHKRRESLFDHIRRGSKSDIISIEKLISNDPRKFLVSPTNENSFLNKRNVSGKTPLYEASLNGYPEIIKLLMDFGANPLIKSQVDGNEMESCLDVACRWGNIKAVEVLLNFSKWKKKDISKARKLTSNPEIRLLLSNYNRRFSNYTVCC
ncbi:unnamed protein product [Blepharisma stoltei]|uniref:Uncharacterized protein n=1 Tax=Blepharisma stoltei TaxID=1481888 RepID=A0AAU9ITL0_9CILI|nr:unnamed protein product [Blepharisma stoltei]